MHYGIFNYPKELKNRLIKEEKANLSEFIGFIIFALIALGAIIPISVEWFAFTEQGQELDRLTKEAAKKACILQMSPNDRVLNGFNQGHLGVASNLTSLPVVVESIFRKESANPDSYFSAGGQVSLTLFDALGQEIARYDSTMGRNNIPLEFNQVGTSKDFVLCPSGSIANGQNWRSCLQTSSNAQVQNSLRNLTITERMEKMQAGRCDPEDPDCNNDFRGILARCTVCATKRRLSVFENTIFNQALACLHANSAGSLFSCSLSTCASSRFLPYSNKRTYLNSYRHNGVGGLGTGYTVFEGDASTSNDNISNDNGIDRVTRSNDLYGEMDNFF